jgi:hypothetical protein
MFQTQKKFEETVTVLNEGSPVAGSGGIAIITDGTSQDIKMVMLPDMNLHREPRKEGQYSYETLFAHVRRDEMDKVNMIPGKTRVVWNGNEYKVIGIIDYRTKVRFQNAEIEMRRRLDID